ncbi:MAG: hypothetical protein ACPGOV_03065 [Magnetovibrionaceae bacterium]
MAEEEGALKKFGRMLGFGGREETRIKRSTTTEESSELDAPLTLDEMLQSMSGRFCKVHIITFGEFREALGERWHTLGDKVMMIADGTVRRHLDRGDFFNRQGDDAFVLVFSKLNEMEGKARAQRIADELGRRLVGAQFQGLEQVAIRTAEVAAEALMGEDGELDMAKLEQAVAEAKPVAPPDGPKSKPAPEAPAHSPTAPAKSGDPKIASDERVARNDDIRMVKIDHPGGNSDGGRMISMDRNGPRGNKSDDLAWQPISEPKLGLPAFLAEADFMFHPTWSAKSESLDAHLLQVQRRDKASGEITIGDRIMPPDPDTETLMAADQEMLDRAVKAIRAMSSQQRSIVVVPVHWRSLMPSNRSKLSAVITPKDEALRLVSLVVEIIGLPADVPPDQVAEVRAFASGLGRDALVRLPLDQPRVEQVCHAGFGGVSLHLFDPAAKVIERMTEDLFCFHALVGNQSLSLWGARRRDDIAMAIENNFAMVNGPALKKPAKKPGPPMKLGRAPLLKLLEKSVRKKEAEKRAKLAKAQPEA